jgi:hypothetical protein
VSIQSYAAQWMRCDLAGNACASVVGATQQTYKLGAADVGSTMRVSVTAMNKNGSTTATSAQTNVVAAPPAPPSPPTNTALPQVSGTAQQGQTLTASTGTWSGSPTAYGYQWQRCNSTGGACAGVAGATASTYALTSTDVGSTMRVLVSATNAGGTATALSTQTALVASAPVATAPASTALPQVSGTAQAGQTLTASTGTWTGSPGSYGYQWKRCDSAGATCASITGATANTFALTTTDVGKTLRVAVTATNGVGSTTATSAQTAVVAAATTSDVYSKPVPRYGISPSFSILQDSPADQAWEVARWVDMGAKIIRLDYVTGTSWAPVADSVIAQTLAAGLEPELCVGCNVHYPWSKTASQYGADCSSVATKYHGKVRYYEIMNEPNGSWNGPWDPTVYVSYLKACYQAVKAVDSRNQVLLGGIAPAPAPGIDAVPWVQRLYAAGAKGYYDVMNMHNYGETDPYLKATYSMWCKTFGCGGVVSPSVVDVMAQYGDSAKPIVSTEGGVNSDSVGETQQSTTVDHYLRYPDPRFKTAYVYCVWCGTGFSVTRPDKSYKPAYTTYKTDAHS